MNGRQVKLFHVDGSPGRLTTTGITNWTGPVLSASRSDLPVSSDPVESQVFTLSNAKAGVQTSAQQVDSEFTLVIGCRVAPRSRVRSEGDEHPEGLRELPDTARVSVGRAGRMSLGVKFIRLVEKQRDL